MPQEQAQQHLPTEGIHANQLTRAGFLAYGSFSTCPFPEASRFQWLWQVLSPLTVAGAAGAFNPFPI